MLMIFVSPTGTNPTHHPYNDNPQIFANRPTFTPPLGRREEDVTVELVIVLLVDRNHPRLEHPDRLVHDTGLAPPPTTPRPQASDLGAAAATDRPGTASIIPRTLPEARRPVLITGSLPDVAFCGWAQPRSRANLVLPFAILGIRRGRCPPLCLSVCVAFRD